MRTQCRNRKHLCLCVCSLCMRLFSMQICVHLLIKCEYSYEHTDQQPASSYVSRLCEFTFVYCVSFIRLHIVPHRLTDSSSADCSSADCSTAEEGGGQLSNILTLTGTLYHNHPEPKRSVCYISTSSSCNSYIPLCLCVCLSDCLRARS